MTIKQALKKATKELAILENPFLEASLILSGVMKKPRIYFIAHEKQLLPLAVLNKFFTLVKKRQCGYPLAYLLQSQEFYGLNFYIDERVLIPRPESEAIIEKAQQWLEQQNSKSFLVADIGTGSGCLALTLAFLNRQKNWKLKIIATDISPAALAVAQYNQQLLGLTKAAIEFRPGDLCQPLTPEKGNFDLILANLPYLTPAEYCNKKEGLIFEPAQALIGGINGDELLQRFQKQAPSYLRQGGQIIYEKRGGKVECLTKENATARVRQTKSL